ncbi:hypothetical protein ASPZODRAFT_76170 [Penicilliopsis zonata CBS 506.65]|uniref:Laccase n=1 Tax=Penicilliopsis zonata CBS 506.65 TaxID=1073090 RepID=A0A1L9S6M9_9EURO|nr:hypothetical protein ASPZODRAFT_76170 [Penicilliopsis zonata CBS 506.65]OJJ42798.1 hypothetical protein ASPZODRAFT_76170 [Penicilliopsis zonata CBS 506.65]
MYAFWTNVVSVLNLFTFSSTSRDVTSIEYPLGNEASVPVASVNAAKPGPIFRAPEVPKGDFEDFKCDYSQMVGWEPCSSEADRSCWLINRATGERFDINTEYEDNTPIGVTRKYEIEVSEQSITPDGVPRTSQVVNGQYPGPIIQGCWGDDIEVTVRNNLTYNGTTIHWHGIRQLNTNAMDGVNAVTQCPIAPGQSFTYKFKTVQYGTTWYHSHYSMQYGEGTLGPLVIHGPSSSNWTEAIEPVLMTDWSHVPFQEQWRKSITTGGSGRLKVDNVLINGIGTWGGTPATNPYTTEFKKGKRYLLRIINTSVDSTFIFSIDSHILEVISADLVPIQPYTTDHIVVGIGQRYHVIVEANPLNDDNAGTFWMRTELAKGCAGNGLNPETWNKEHSTTGIVCYDEHCSPPVASPTSRRGTFDDDCHDEPYDKLVPVVPWLVGAPSNFASDGQFELDMEFYQGLPLYPSDRALQRWNMYTSTMWLNFSNPSLRMVEEGSKAGDFSQYAVVVNQTHPHNEWVYLLISGTTKNLPKSAHPKTHHPIHLHGHDFAILEQSTKPLQIGQLKLNLENPPRRDVAFLPASGYLVLAFKTDNPGVWLMHCHIAFHASGGLALQILENTNEIKLDDDDYARLNETCAQWDSWKNTSQDGKQFLQDDSGI